MKESNSVYILHVSDFHISEESQEEAKKALENLTKKLDEKNICISYLVHTGDIINSSDIEQEITQQYGSAMAKARYAEKYDKLLRTFVSEKFEIAKETMEEFIKDLGVSNKNVVICCGNHDKVRYHKKTEEDECSEKIDGAFQPFAEFLYNITSHKKLMECFELDDVKVLVMNTNYSNDKRVTCLRCKEINEILKEQSKSEKKEDTWFYKNKKKKKHSVIDEKRDKVNIIVAHQPLYDVCEYARLPYSAETQTTDFLSALQDFIKGNGIYLCGDKHTSSIAASYIHDIPHYFCGHPFTFKKTTRPECCIRDKKTNLPKKEIEYNLIEIRDGKIGEIKKLHLSHNADKWTCEIHPIDTVVADLYEKSRKHIVSYSFSLIESKSNTKYNSLKNLSWHNFSKRLDEIINSQDTLEKISDFHILFCDLKGWDLPEDFLKKNREQHVFEKLSEIIGACFKSEESIQNIINVRGDYSSGKSTFLGILYMYLLHCYSHGKINYIPAYFNMENDEICDQIKEGKDYSSAVKKIFSFFVDEIKKIAELERVPVCYIIDGLDEQDIWSESSKDSVGRVIVDILEETKNAKYIMSFCQNNLAKFKNTMPTIKFYEKSYVMYFNSIPIKETEKFHKFTSDFIGSNEQPNAEKKSEPQICSPIKKLRKLNVNSGFIYHNYEYLKSCKETDYVDTVYMRYIENQHRICMDELGYNFIHYAPAMAYLFSYEGYTYEKFKNIPPNSTNYFEKKIVENSAKIYNAFVFIKKHKDAREYLIALHYNRALRYFAENPKEEIPENSILNKIISRNISLIIKMQWRNDQNKFVIVCHDLINRQDKGGRNNIGKSTLSMLVYIWTYLDKIPFGTNEELETLLINADETNCSWRISDEGSKMQQFVDLNYLHSKEIFHAIKAKDSTALVYKLLKDEHFLVYNRQYMMWYYGDLTIYGRRNVNNLIPGSDIPNKGMDYYWCFYTLYQKISDSFADKKNAHYPLLAYDVFTIFDLVYSRSRKLCQRDDLKLKALDSILNLCKITRECIVKYLFGELGIESEGKEVQKTNTSTMGENGGKEVQKANTSSAAESAGQGEQETNLSIESESEYKQYQKWIERTKEEGDCKNVSTFFIAAAKAMEPIISSVQGKIDANSTNNKEEYASTNKEMLDDGGTVSKNHDNKKQTKKLKITRQPKNVVVEKSGDRAAVTIKAKGENLLYTWYYQNPGEKEFLKSTSKYVDGNRYEIPLQKAINGQKVYCVIEDSAGTMEKSEIVSLSLKSAKSVDVT